MSGETPWEVWYSASPNKRKNWNIQLPDCLQTAAEESIKHNTGSFLSWSLPVGFFETPVWHWKLYALTWKHQSFILMFELISGEHLQNKKIWCGLWDLRPSEIPQAVFKCLFLRLRSNSQQSPIHHNIWQSCKPHGCVLTSHHLMEFPSLSGVKLILDLDWKWLKGLTGSYD